MENSKENPVLRERLTSIDALRGFTMFWIIGGDRIMRALPKISDNAVFRVLDEQLRHKSWEGLNFYDIIFPLFLFIIGVSSYFSYKSRQGRGESKLNLYKHIFTRAAILFALGLIYYGAKDPQLKSLGYYGVLQLLAFGYLFSSLIMINTSVRGIAIWAGGIIIFYFLIMKFIPVPDYGAGVFTQKGNFSNYISGIVATHIGAKWRIILSPYMIPTVSTALLGILAGIWMHSKNEPMKKVKGLLIAGISLIAAGLLFSIWFPVIKNLWSSSYVLVTGGISALLLGIFYWVIDIRQYKKWAFFFVVIGLNPITIYMLEQLINFRNISVMISLGFIEYFGTAQELVLALLTTTLHWFLVYWLYRQKIFIKI